MTLLLLFAAIAAAILPPAQAGGRGGIESSSASAAALDEFRAGRFWHAALLMREDGLADGEPRDVLLLARAEAGWENWPAVGPLLEGSDWLSTLDGGEGAYLLGRAREDAEAWAGAADAYGRVDSGPRFDLAQARRVRAFWRAGRPADALDQLDAVLEPVLASWVAVGVALDAGEDGDTTSAFAFADRIEDPEARRAVWRLEADARLAAGDSAGAARAFAAARAEASGVRRAVASVELGLLELAAGDSAAAGNDLLQGLEGGPLSSRARAAVGLLAIGGDDGAFTLRLARTLDRAGDGRQALRAYDRGVRLTAEEGGAVPLSMRIERARLMGTVRGRQTEAIEEFRAIRESTDNARIGARNLEQWARLRRRQGLTRHVATLRRWLLEEYPGSDEAVEVVWSRASQAEGGGRVRDALEKYAFIAEHAPTHARAGQARMRSGQIRLSRSDPEGAAEVFESYLHDFPTGRRWTEAAYWSGRTRLELGDTAAAHADLRRILREDPVSYYAVVASELLGVPFRVKLPAGERSPVPDWLAEGLHRLDRLTEAGLPRGSSAEIARLIERARGSTGATLDLAEALIARGRTVDGINLGWALRADGHEWDERLLRVAYPFPYRELVRREAEEWGLDPLVMAALIRQESAFKADIVSHAGAVGLMQVMPPTGAQLARAHGPAGFRRGNLTAPEVNLHLGAAFFVEMSARYDGELPLVLSAYNAGPTRASRWRRYPEAADPLRFTERIPFVETRGYVKNVRRNMGLYRALYGDD
jgi:peptidoglycan lytic transglycosylase